MLVEGGTQVTVYPKLVTATIAAAILVFAVLGLSACGNNGVSAPPTNLDNQTEDLYPINDPSNVNWRIDINDSEDDKPSELKYIPKDEIGTQSVQDLASALFLLRGSGGGVTDLASLPDDQFAVHIWSKATKANLEGEIAVVCNNEMSAVLDVGGWAVFENATFPITVTARAPGYALNTVVNTDSNVISLAMVQSTIPPTASVFGVAKNWGLGAVTLYSDELFPRRFLAPPSLANPNFGQFEIPFTAGVDHGFSAFLDGTLGFGSDEESLSYPPALPLFYMSAYFAYDIPPLNEGDHRFYSLPMTISVGPMGVAEGHATLPVAYWDDGDILTDSTVCAIPTAVFTEEELYIPIGPARPITGEAADLLNYECPYFEPTGQAERLVMAGQIMWPSGARDVVHMDWHPGTQPADIDFSGYPVFESAVPIEGNMPMFVWLNPLEDETDLIRIEAMAGGIPVWMITMDGAAENLDTSDLGIPPQWLTVIVTDAGIPPSYRCQCMNVLGQTINEYTEQDIVMWRRESCFSPWLSEL
jgi:hypothetical protein